MANTCYVVYGIRPANEFSDERRVNISVHKTWGGMMTDKAEYEEHIKSYRDGKGSFTYNWDFSYIDFDTFILKD